MVYTISTNFFEQLEEGDYPCMASILFQLSNYRTVHKVAVDSHSRILEIYREISQHTFCAEIVKSWLVLLSNTPSSCEKCNVDLSGIANKEEMCLKLCSRVNGSKNLLIYSANSYPMPLDENNLLSYGGVFIKAVDKEEAEAQLNSYGATIYNNSMVAQGNISNSSNTTHYEK